MYAAAAYEASDLEKHDTLVTKEGEAVKVNHLRLSQRLISKIYSKIYKKFILYEYLFKLEVGSCRACAQYMFCASTAKSSLKRL